MSAMTDVKMEDHYQTVDSGMKSLNLSPLTEGVSGAVSSSTAELEESRLNNLILENKI